MKKEQIEDIKWIVEEAVKSNDRRIEHIQTFLDSFPLDTDVNKTVALELATMMAFIEKDSQEMRDKFNKINEA